MAEEKEELVKFCPHCGSIKLKMAITPWKVSTAFFNNYYCTECGFEGYILEGNEEVINEFRGKAEKHNAQKKK